ncbi:MAG: DUF92 domain-containing protein [Chloroflexota bacterium]
MSLGGLALGAALAGLIAVAAYALGALSTSGALGALGVGAVTFGLGGFTPAVLLVLFFVSSSGLSRLGKGRKRSVAAAFSKGSRRDLGQVLANGGVAAACSLLYGVTAQSVWLVALTGALAAANGDTWATELGVLSGSRPRLITTGALVEPGTSGGVSLMGTLAAVAGAALIGAAATGLEAEPRLALVAVLGGLAGALFDSLLGATVQAMYFCPVCGRETERHPRHTCGAETRRIRGLAWLDNDGVNLAATIVGSWTAWIIWILVLPPVVSG